MLKANRLTAGQILRFKLEVQLQRAVCSTSCSRNPEVRPTHCAPSVLFHPVGCIKQEQSQQCPDNNCDSKTVIKLTYQVAAAVSCKGLSQDNVTAQAVFEI